ncbi:MAG: peptidase [Micrococcales bacterium]|nr:MAG: peptidase [Micrococcales bacterium]
MAEYAEPHVEVAPFSRGDADSLSGFIIAGRWPATTLEWAKFLTLAVRFAALPGMVASTTVYRTTDDRLQTEDMPDPVGMVLCAGPVIGDGAPQPGALSTPAPVAVLLLHPPQESRPSIPEVEGAASGCVLLPGVPALGLGHRAVWVEADREGSVSRLVSSNRVDPRSDPDTAVLALLCAA